jgi:hypothetical protein
MHLLHLFHCLIFQVLCAEILDIDERPVIFHGNLQAMISLKNKSQSPESISYMNEIGKGEKME